MIFLDTCILIDYSKGKIDLQDKTKCCISSIVQIEFKVGALNKREQKKINRILSEFNIVDTDQEVLNLATNLIDSYALSHNMSIYDSIIAATCMIYGLSLWTHNKKDFKYIEELQLFE